MSHDGNNHTVTNSLDINNRVGMTILMALPILMSTQMGYDDVVILLPIPYLLNLEGNIRYVKPILVVFL